MILPANAPAGLCPRCLMALNLNTETVFTGEVTAAQPSLPPEDIAPYFPQLEILECLGRGGMGVVYKARQKSLNRLVALKLLAPERVHDGKFAGRFTREAHALGALNHPNIVTIFDFGQAGGFYFLLMEFVDGANLRQLLAAQKFTPEEALAIVPPICEALQFAHERGIVHRDIKPENLLLDKEGRVKIADFGIAKMLGEDAAGAAPAEQRATEDTLASAAGTPHYMAPEQREHRATDHRADIYSLGVVLYEMLTGELPGKPIEPPSSRMRGRVRIDVRLDAVVLRALERKPELRYQQVSDVKTMVETIATSPDSSPPEASEPQGRLLDFIRIPFVKLRDGRPVTNWPAAVVTGTVMAGIVVMITAFAMPDVLEKPVLFAMVLPLVALIPLWLFLEIRAGHRALEQGAQPLTLFAKRKDRLHRWVGVFLVALFTAFFVRTFLIAAYSIPTDVAAPEIPRGSLVLVWKLTHRFAPGDLIVYKHENGPYVGRVVRIDGGLISVGRNREPDVPLPRDATLGKVITVLWRASAGNRTVP